VEISSHSQKIEIPNASWRQLLQQNNGKQLRIDVYARTQAKKWQRFVTITNQVAMDKVDPYLIYRKIHAAHSTWSSMGLYQRNLENFEESPFLENRRFANDCCHCHMLRNNDPNT